MDKFILYNTHNSLPEEMEVYFQQKLLEACGDIPVIAVSKHPRTTFAYKNIIVDYPKNNWNSILYQTEVGINAILSENDKAIVYIAEHDVLYPPSYFENVPPDDNTFMKNINLYFVNNVGFLGPHNDYIHSQTIASVKLFDFCLKEKENERIRFKDKSKYNLIKFNNIHPSLDIRHGYNYTGGRENDKKVHLKELPYWGSYEELRKSLPPFKQKSPN